VVPDDPLQAKKTDYENTLTLIKFLLPTYPNKEGHSPNVQAVHLNLIWGRMILVNCQKHAFSLNKWEENL
jgi:hypothetical protein